MTAKPEVIEAVRSALIALGLSATIPQLARWVRVNRPGLNPEPGDFRRQLAAELVRFNN